MTIRAYRPTPEDVKREPRLKDVDVVVEWGGRLPLNGAAGTILHLANGTARKLVTAVHQASRPALAGKSPIDLLWEELDSLMSDLMGDDPDDITKGQARGVAYALALLSNPYAPDVDAIREEAVRRYEAASA